MTMNVRFCFWKW